MRISQNYGIDTLLRQINENRSKIYDLQSSIASGKKLTKISDDPENIGSLLKFKNALKNNNHFQKNIENALDFMTSTSQALDDAINIMTTAKEYAIRGRGSLGENEWNTIADQVDQLLKEMVDVGNTKFNDRYVFGGAYTKETPFSLSTDGTQVTENPNGIEGNLKVEYGQSQVEQYNISGKAAFREGVDVFQTLADLKDALQTQDSSGIEVLLGNIDQSIEQLSAQNTNIGAKINRFEMYHQQYESQNTQLQEMSSKLEDTDVAKAIMELQMKETGLNATLQVLAKKFNMSLMDFLR